MAYKRVLLKLSGEALKGNSNELLDVNSVSKAAEIVRKIQEKGIKLAIVVGGGNIIRGRISDKYNLDRVPADFMGMLATNLNAIMVQNLFEKNGIKCKAYSALPVDTVLEKIDIEKCKKDLDENTVIIFGGGTGKPFVSTDSGSSLRATQLNLEVILAGKHGVDGVYDKDPFKFKDAKFIKKLSYDYAIENSLQVFDIGAVQTCKENNIEIKIFNMDNLENILKIIDGEDIGSTIGKE